MHNHTKIKSRLYISRTKLFQHLPHHIRLTWTQVDEVKISYWCSIRHRNPISDLLSCNMAWSFLLYQLAYMISSHSSSSSGIVHFMFQVIKLRLFSNSLWILMKEKQVSQVRLIRNLLSYTRLVCRVVSKSSLQCFESTTVWLWRRDLRHEL